MLKRHGNAMEGKTVVVSGSGNVAIYAAEKAIGLGAKVVTVSDSAGFVYDEQGIDVPLLKEIKEVRRGRISEYVAARPKAEYFEGAKPWAIPCHIALPCATQNEIDEGDARTLIKNGCIAVAEGANMPSTAEATDAFLAAKVLFAPGKAANAGGVATSALEMSQNSTRSSWTFEKVNAELNQIMVNIYTNMDEAAKQYGAKDNFVVGANIAGFLKVADAMMAQGVV